MKERTHIQLRVLPGGLSEQEDKSTEVTEEYEITEFPVEAIFSSAEALLDHWFKERKPDPKDIPFWKETAYNDALIVLRNLKRSGYLK